MRAVVQRVDSAMLTVDNKVIAKIEKGFSVYLGVHINDTEEKCERLAKKVASLRIFRDENDKMNYSIKDIGGEILVISNFTIYADTSRGKRPNFMYAMEAEKANLLYEKFVEFLRAKEITVQTGVFGGHMIINQVLNGPVNVIVEE